MTPISNIFRATRPVATRYAWVKPCTRFPGLYIRCRNYTSSEPRRDNASDDPAHRSHNPPHGPTEQAPQNHTLSPDASVDVVALKSEIGILGMRLDNLESSVTGVKRYMHDLANRMDRGFDKMDRKFDNADSKIDRKFERTDTKIDRAVYYFIGALVLKGGFDLYLRAELQTKGNAPASK